MANEFLSSISIDDLFQLTNVGSLDKAVGNNLFGIDHMQMPGALPASLESAGYVFWPRPQLNMQSDNLRTLRKMSNLLSNRPDSIQRYIRCMLDPRVMTDYQYNLKAKVIPALSCPIIDPEMAFIPFLTNNCLSVSGWPDQITPTMTYEPGKHGETMAVVDGLTDIYGEFSLDCTFRNVAGDPGPYMFFIWQHYMSSVFRGPMVPYMDMITDIRLDYNTRVWRVILDKTRNRVVKLASTGLAIPVTNPTGQYSEYNSDKPYSEQTKEYTIRFQCFGFEIFDSILVKEFNDTVSNFNPRMKDEYRIRSMLRVPRNAYSQFRWKVYPRIDPETMNMEWWTDPVFYRNRMSAISSYFYPNGTSEDAENMPNGDTGVLG